MIKYKSLIIVVVLIISQDLFGQKLDDIQLFRTITTATPFLTIAPDARSAALGDAGVAISPDANSIYWNASKLAFSKETGAFSISYTPWLRALNIPDMNLLFLSGFKKIGNDQAISGSLRYFSLGEIIYTDATGAPGQTAKPNEFAFSTGYSRKLSDMFSGGVVAKFIYSDISPGYYSQSAGQTKAGTSIAADVSAYYLNDRLSVGGMKSSLAFGLNASNIGAKISYTSSSNKDFLPTNLKLGTAFKLELDEYNEVTFLVDVNKLMVPTPSSTSKDQSVASGIFSSFSDAPGGFNEEMQEITYSPAIEYWYDKQFAIRGGYFYEDPSKGNRKYLTFGAGLKYNIFNLDFAYLIPTTQRNPLENTLRFTLSFDFDVIKGNGR